MLFVLITAIVAPPNVWDAMEYHLPRVVMWMSNRSVRFFPTPDYAQLIFAPWAEYSMMHTYLLWGSDRFVNLVDFFSMFGCVIGVSLIAKFLGAGPRGQALAAVVCATIPEGVLEASGPMNTYVVSFWIVAVIVFLMSSNHDSGWLNTYCVGLAAGLALITKGSAYVYLPFLVLACWWMGSASARIRFLKRCGIFLLLIVALNGPQYVRSYELTGSPLGMPFPDGGPTLRWRGDDHSVKGTIANVLRNASLHFATPSSSVNRHIGGVVRAAIRTIGVNPDDPRMVWGGNFEMNHFSFHEIHAGNPFHFALIFLSVGLVLFWWRREGARGEATLLGLGLLAAFFLFCASLRWQTWASRQHLPLFVLGSALVGLILESHFSRRVATALGILLLAYALPFATTNRIRSLIPWSQVNDVYHPRSVLYFSDLHEMIASSHIAAADTVNKLNCSNVAIDSYLALPPSQMTTDPLSFYVYPILAMIHADGRARRVWYTGVHNWSTRYQAGESHPPPCAVICLECAGIPEKWAEYQPLGGRASVFGNVVVFSDFGQGSNAGAEAGRGGTISARIPRSSRRKLIVLRSSENGIEFPLMRAIVKRDEK